MTELRAAPASSGARGAPASDELARLLAELRTRLAAAGPGDDGARRAQLKRERAARYAGVEGDDSPAASDEQGEAAVLLRVGPERLAVPAARTLAVLAPARAGEPLESGAVVEPLPLAPPTIAGAIAFRGAPVLVVTLHALQGASPPGPDALHVVVRLGQGCASLLADAVEGTRRIGPADVRPAGAHAWLPACALRGELPCGATLVDLDGLAGALALEANA